MVDAVMIPDKKAKRVSRSIRYGVIIFLMILGGFGLTDSPYYRITPGPVPRIGVPARGSWAVTTVVVQHGTWFRWALAGINGERLARGGTAVSATAYPLGVVQGPSAGLMLTLARVGALGSGGLTGGHNVAGTGGVSLVGSVTEVGEVAEKVKAAVAARADVFFVPVLQRDIAVQAARDSTVRIVPVRSVSDAVRWLCAADGHSPACKPSL
jgi:hypothetical protein